MDTYKAARKRKQECIFRIIEKHDMLPSLRGSWKSEDFHYDLNQNKSLSDIDLIAEGISKKESEEITRSITRETSHFFNSPLSSSIHPQDSLGMMSITDSKFLNIGEYIYKYRKYISTGDGQLEYNRVKIIFFLLRRSHQETYINTANRIGTIEGQHALDVKLGIRKIFPLEAAEQLIRSGDFEVALDFLDNCILGNPDDKFVEYIANRIKQAKSIDEWLQKYIIKKMYMYS